MIKQDQKTIEAKEVTFFKGYYENKAYNSTGWQLRLNRELRLLQSASGIKQFRRVLSVGCGDGEFELLLAPLAEHITALDISPEAIEIARRKAIQLGKTNVDFRCLPLSKINWDEQFDTVICLAFLHHVPESDLPAFLQEVYQHLKPGGLLYSQDPNIYGILRKIGKSICGDSYNQYHTPNERELDPQKLSSLLRQAGFDLISIIYLDLLLIPTTYILAKGPNWPLYLCSGLDWLWCHSPFARWGSGFAAIARKKIS
jgi:2-polyprenyl-3-methyl-5-hydroxy-6-metoxy-1,4-benzoquinol methylase